MPIWNERIRQMRLEKGITLSQIAERLGVTEATAQRYECGSIKTIPYEHMCAYGEILNCSPAYLMGWENGISKNTQENTYYTDNDVKEAAQFLFDNPEYRVLFDATRKVKPEDIQFVKEMLDRFNKE